ncbi:ComF family protein [Rarobacter incanus]|nr:phosphoribosyltransferase family protein [Rarobacter incanus]
MGTFAGDDQRRAGPSWRAICTAIGHVVVPVRCAGCGLYDTQLCAPCRAMWERKPFRCEQFAGRLDLADGGHAMPVWALSHYRDEPREVILAAKEGGRHDLHALLGLAAVRAGKAARAHVGGGRMLAAVPVPSRPATIRRRGADLTAALARHVASAGAMGCAPALRAHNRRADQVGLGAAGRARNQAGSVSVRAGALPVGRDVILVDDIVTTGATLRECQLVLGRANVRVVGAVVLACAVAPGGSVYASLSKSG